MTIVQGFIGFLALTLALLAGVVLSGRRRARGLHLGCVLSALAALGTTIYFAERMGRTLDLAAAGAITPIHLIVAKATTLGYLLPVVSGILVWRDERWKRRHRIAAYSVLALTILTAITGTWMVLAASPKAP